jgi:hypothetical protein
MPVRHPLSLTDSQRRAVSTAAASLPPWQRARFLRIVTDQIEPLQYPGDLAVQRSIAIALRVLGNSDHSGEDAA